MQVAPISVAAFDRGLKARASATSTGSPCCRPTRLAIIRLHTKSIISGATVPVGTAFHERTFPLCYSLNYREWSGYYTVSVYETHHEHEYNAIRNAAALIDITPLFKYMVSGKDATRLVNRVIARDINKVSVGQVIYCCWCDEEGKVIDDGTITRLEENKYRWTAADPSLRWFRQNALGMDVQIEDISEKTAALAVQGPTSGRLLKTVCDADIANLKYFRVTHGKLEGVPVDISRTGYTGDLGYEIWVQWNDAVKVWDALMKAGKQFDVHPTGMLALDVARIEAGLILIEVDYVSSKKALTAEQEWSEVERFYDQLGMAPQTPSTASRVHVPVYKGGKQVGKATSTTWSPLLKKMIALASVQREHSAVGSKLKMEFTVESVRKNVTATVVKLPFFNPPRQTAVPV